MFDDILERKKAFLDPKIKTLKKSKNQDFSEGVIVHGFGKKKKMKLFHLFIFGKKKKPAKYVS